MQNESPTPPPGAGMPTIDITLLLERLWSHRLRGAVAMLLGLLGGILYLHLATYEFKAQIGVTPVETNSQKLPGNIASIGSLVGMNLDAQGGANFILFSESVLSYSVAEQLSRDPAIMHTIFRKSWNQRTGQWQQPASIVRPVTGTLKAMLGIPVQPWTPPDAVSLHDYIQKEVSVEENVKKPVITIAYHNEDPAFAAAMVRKIVNASDEFMRRRSLERATRYVAYLENRLAGVQVTEYRQALAQALASYERTRMMASSSTSFAADKFGDVVVTSRPARPVPVLVLFLAMVLGVMGWIVTELVGALRTGPGSAMPASSGAD